MGAGTAGYITVNTGIPINQAAFMNLSVGYSADRKRNIYKEAIGPDIQFAAADRFYDIPNDEKVQAAVKWLESHID